MSIVTGGDITISTGVLTAVINSTLANENNSAFATKLKLCVARSASSVIPQYFMFTCHIMTTFLHPTP